jgi:hypothetical protein
VSDRLKEGFRIARCVDGWVVRSLPGSPLVADSH